MSRNAWRDVQRVTSTRMKAVRRMGTTPEVTVEERLRSLGLRFWKHAKALPGSPDFYSRAGSWTLFVHGCFWHGHKGCRLFRLPRNNSQAWSKKVDSNRRRDLRKARQLRAAGWSVYTIWQCDTESPRRLEIKLNRLIYSSRTRGGVRR